MKDCQGGKYTIHSLETEASNMCSELIYIQLHRQEGEEAGRLTARDFGGEGLSESPLPPRCTPGGEKEPAAAPSGHPSSHMPLCQERGWHSLSIIPEL